MVRCFRSVEDFKENTHTDKAHPNHNKNLRIFVIRRRGIFNYLVPKKKMYERYIVQRNSKKAVEIL